MDNLLKIIKFSDRTKVGSDLVCNNISDHQKSNLIERVAIFGYADAKVGDALYQDTFNVAKALAEIGYVVVDGGGPGVMKAATQGAKTGKGRVIGVTFYPKDIKNFEGKDPQNEVDEEVITHSYVERTLTLMERGQVYVVFNGGTGTISEFGMAWGLARLYFGHHKPLILYGNFWKEILQAFKKNMKLRPEEMMVFKVANSPHEVASAITSFGKEVEAGLHKENLKITNNGANTNGVKA